MKTAQYAVPIAILSITTIFVLLKAFGVLNWAWWVVFSPIIVIIGINTIVLMLIFVLTKIMNWIERKADEL
jgi:hypothetical protein